MMLFSDDTTCFPNLFREELLFPPRPAKDDQIFTDPIPPDTLMVAEPRLVLGLKFSPCHIKCLDTN